MSSKMFIFCGMLTLLVIRGGAIPLNSNIVEVSENDIARAATEYRLPKNVIPSHYDLWLEPDFTKFNFNGEAHIDIKVLENVTTIIIHAQNLTFDAENSMLLFSNGSQTKNTFKATLFPENDFYSMAFTSPVKVGDYILKFKYTGILHNDLYGFYRSSYINELGEKVWLATTQFQPTFARRAFPCFDEPALKATFKIRIRHLDNYTAISNMQAVSQTRPNNDYLRWETEFEKTPVMSTYLIAFVVSDFKYLSNEKGDFRIYSRSNKIKNGKYAEEVGSKELQELIKYTSKAFGVPKMDNIAIPQFAAGAMENWGLVTYRESALLFDENVTSSNSKEDIASIMSHEFAHQWFGNWVSPVWWDYTWLNEGFANYFQFVITNMVEPTMRFMDLFVVNNLQKTAFTADDNEKVHPMDTKVNSPAEIRSNFDSITYSKAGSVIRMFSHAITEATFKEGLRQYLKAKENKAATSDDLINSLVAAVSKVGIYEKADLNVFFKSWIQQPGYPVITINRNYTTATATITQKRFLTNPTKPPTELWMIPTNYISQDNIDFNKTVPTLWIPEKNESTVVKGLKSDKWVIFNVQQTGYYRVNYDIKNWEMIATYLADSKQMGTIHLLNRAQLLDDSFKLGEAGELPNHSVFLKITKYLENEVDPIPWIPARSSLTKLKKKLANSDFYDIFKLYMLSLMNKLEQSLGYEESSKDEDITTKIHRIGVVHLACEMGSKECLKSTNAQLLEFMEGSKKLSPDLRSVVLCAGMRSADEATWKKAYDLVAKNNKSAVYNDLSNALGCSSNKEIIKSCLDSTLLIESPLNWKSIINAVINVNSFGADIAFDFIKNNMKNLTEEDSRLSAVKSTLVKIAKAMTTSAQVSKLKGWMESLKAEEHKDFVAYLQKNALAVSNDNVQWVAKHEPVIKEFLKAQKLVEENKKDGGDFAAISVPSIPLLTSTILAVAWRHF